MSICEKLLEARAAFRRLHSGLSEAEDRESKNHAFSTLSDYFPLLEHALDITSRIDTKKYESTSGVYCISLSRQVAGCAFETYKKCAAEELKTAKSKNEGRDRLIYLKNKLNDRDILEDCCRVFEAAYYTFYPSDTPQNLTGKSSRTKRIYD